MNEGIQDKNGGPAQAEPSLSHRLDEVYQFRPALMLDAGPGLFALKLQDGCGTLLLDRISLEAALSCTQAGSLAEHRQRVDGMLRSPSRASELIQALLRGGFLISHGSLLHALTEYDEGQDLPVPGLSVMGVPTKGRPRALRAALESYGENASRWQRMPVFKVIDYSGSEYSTENERSCRQLARSRGLTVMYAGPSHVNAFATEFSRFGGIPEAVTRFALGLSASTQRELATGSLHTYGSVRNALLLESAGTMFISVDDDTECVTSEPAPPDRSLTFPSQPLPFRWRLQHPLSAEEADFDFIGRHELALGKQVSTILREGKEPLRLDYGSADLRDVPRCRRLTITRSFLGVDGDSGLRSLLSPLVFAGDQVEALPERDDICLEMIARHQCTRWVPRWMVGGSPFCMGINMGLDNRAILPPFFPFQRNEDGLFGALLDAIGEEHAVAFLPGTIRHRPPEDRTASTREPWRDLTRWRVPDFLMALISLSARQSLPGLFRRTLQGIGEDLIGIGRLPYSSFRDLLTNLRHVNLLQQLNASDAILSSASPDGFICRALGEFRRALLDALTHSGGVDVVDLEGSEEERVTILRELILSYGMLLRHWPAMHECAIAFRTQGRGLCREITRVR